MDKSCLFVICAAPLANRAVDVAQSLVDDGWTVVPVATPAASDGWVDADALRQVTGNPLRSTFGQHEGPDPRHTDAVVVCPATFNTINKIALGISDNYALALLAESLGRKARVLMVPFVNETLWKHPRFAANLAELMARGVGVVDPTGHETPQPLPHGSGTATSRSFPVASLVRELAAPST